MYIPRPRSPAAADNPVGLAAAILPKRQAATVAAGNPDQTNVTIGAVVGVVLALFLVAIFFFLWKYRFSVRFTSKKKSKRRKSAGSKSSKSSSDSGGGAPPPPAPPPADPPAEG